MALSSPLLKRADDILLTAAPGFPQAMNCNDATALTRWTYSGSAPCTADTEKAFQKKVGQSASNHPASKPGCPAYVTTAISLQLAASAAEEISTTTHVWRFAKMITGPPK